MFLGIELKFKRLEYPEMIDPRGVADLYDVKTEEDKGIFIGSGFSLSEMDDILKEHQKLVGGT